MFLKLFYIVIISVEVNAYCRGNFLVNITDGLRNGTEVEKYDTIFTQEDYYWDVDVQWGCICNVKNCIRKCCSRDQILTNDTCQVSNDNYIFYDYLQTFEFKNESHYLVDSVLQCDAKNNFFRFKFGSDSFSLLPNGSVFFSLEEETEEGPYNYTKILAIENYCLDVYKLDNESQVWGLFCFEDTEAKETPKHIGMIISMPFLLMTFLAYLILPESNIHRKSLMCYVLTLLIGYIFLVAIQLNENYIVTGWCHFLGYSIVYFFLASFFWMNVMCIDMWLAFSGIRGFKGKKSTELKRFLAYFLYAMGMPFSLLLIIFLLNTYADESSIFHPHLGQSRCFLEDGYPNLFYFYLPMAIIIGINIVLFILTAVRIQRVKKETSMLKHSDSKRHSYEEDKQKFNLYLKLLFAMGINWSMEVISWAVEWKVTVMPTWIWYLTDFANAAYGVFIFFIFVFKKKIWITLKKRYYVLIGKPHLAHTLSTSQPGRTSTTNYSTTDTALNETRLSELKNGRPEERPLNRH